jgi:hypothetical protein
MWEITKATGRFVVDLVVASCTCVRLCVTTNESELVFVVDTLTTYQEDTRPLAIQSYAPLQNSSHLEGHYRIDYATFTGKTAHLRHAPAFCMGPEVKEKKFLGSIYKTVPMSYNIIQNCNAFSLLYSDRRANAFKNQLVKMSGSETRIDPSFVHSLRSGNDCMLNSFDLIHTWVTKQISDTSVMRTTDPALKCIPTA